VRAPARKPRWLNPAPQYRSQGHVSRRGAQARIAWRNASRNAVDVTWKRNGGEHAWSFLRTSRVFDISSTKRRCPGCIGREQTAAKRERRPKNASTGTGLSDVDISHDQSSRWQKFAAVPEEIFEREVQGKPQSCRRLVNSDQSEPESGHRQRRPGMSALCATTGPIHRRSVSPFPGIRRTNVRSCAGGRRPERRIRERDGGRRQSQSVNPVSKHSVRGSGCKVGRRQVASLDRRISRAQIQVGGHHAENGVVGPPHPIGCGSTGGNGTQNSTAYCSSGRPAPCRDNRRHFRFTWCLGEG